MNETHQYCTFLLDDLLFGVDVLAVQEVIREQAMTPVPLGPPVVKGLINLRGQIVTALDLRTRLGMPARTEQGETMNVVVRTDDGAVSLLVDEIGDVVDAESDDFEPPPDTLRGTGREVIKGVYKFPGRLLHVLDTERTVGLAGAGRTDD